MNKYSIILPVYNGGEYLKECIHSILAQTLQDFDLIVLDNASNDGSLEWIESLENKKIILYRSNQPLSIEQNWARIVSVPKNEFITLIGHDDILFPHYLQTMDELIAKYPNASLYQTHFSFIDSNGKVLRNSQPMEEVQYADGFLKCQIFQSLDSTGTGYMMRSKDYDSIYGISSRYPRLIFADYELWVKLIMKKYKATSSTIAFSYRLHNSTSKLTNGEDYQEAFGIYMHFLNELKTNQEVREVLEKYAQKMVLYFCESLSHRLLRAGSASKVTPVSQFVNQCKVYSKMLAPHQSFNPLLKPGILAAILLDNRVGLILFSIYQKIKSYKG